MIDLDAAKAARVAAMEVAASSQPLKFGGKVFDLPVELPGDVLGPFLEEDLGLIEVLADVLSSADDEEDISTLLFDALEKKPTLPAGLLKASRGALKALVGDRYDEFVALRPSVPDYMFLARSLFETYGLSLGDFFGSPSSSDSDGTTSSATSPTTTPASTPEASGDAPVIPDSSDSAA